MGVSAAAFLEFLGGLGAAGGTAAAVGEAAAVGGGLGFAGTAAAGTAALGAGLGVAGESLAAGDILTAATGGAGFGGEALAGLTAEETAAGVGLLPGAVPAEAAGAGLGTAGALADGGDKATILSAGNAAEDASSAAIANAGTDFNLGSALSSIFGSGGYGQPLFKIGSALYSLNEASKLKKLATRPNLMGEQAVQRSLAAQGYQGSGKMMSALQEYGINGSYLASQAGMGPLLGQLSSLGLLSSGLQQLFPKG